MTILDQVAAKQKCPVGSVEDTVGLRIAQRFGDRDNLPWYVRCVNSRGTDMAFRVYRRCKPQKGGAAERFRKMLDD